MNELDVQSFWQSHPCGDGLIGGLEQFHDDYESYYSHFDAYRYSKEKHILDCLDQIDFKNKDTLEIGLGLGADAEQIIRRQANWSGIDLTAESVNRVLTRLQLRKLPYVTVKQGSVLDLPFADNSFDIVFSHGVLHHVPEIKRAQEEIHRVLRPGGKLVVMLYAKYSLNYLFSIAIVRRLGLLALYASSYDPGGIYHEHLKNAKKSGVLNYLRMNNFVHRNTDGPLNPYAKVYDLAAVAQDFSNFRIIRSHKEFMHAPPLPIKWLPLDHLLGWHLWVEMEPSKKPPAMEKNASH